MEHTTIHIESQIIFYTYIVTYCFMLNKSFSQTIKKKQKPINLHVYAYALGVRVVISLMLRCNEQVLYNVCNELMSIDQVLYVCWLYYSR